MDNNNNGHRIQGFNPFTWFALIKIKIESVDMGVFLRDHKARSIVRVVIHLRDSDHVMPVSCA